MRAVTTRGADELTVRRPYHRIAISVDIVARLLSFFVNDGLYGQYPVAIGKPATPSPVGNWHIRTKVVNPGGVLGSRWMGLSVPWGNYGIHGTNAPWSIGRAISNGCIRMHNQHIEELFPLCRVGDPVCITAVGEVASPTPSSWHDLSPPAAGTLRRGAVGPEVLRLQQELARCGYYRGPIDATYGALTESAVMAFQRDQGLAVDGVAGPETRQRLEGIMMKQR